MKLTVNDVLSLHPLNQSTVIAGKNGLLREIHSVTLIEVPDRSEFLQPHLLAISSLFAIANDVEGQLSLIRLLAEHNGCGLVLFNVGQIMPCVHHDLIDLCDKLDFPLITMPLEVSYYQVIEVVMDKLLERQSQKLETSISLYEAFMDQLLNSRDDYSSMLGMLKRSIRHELFLFNHNLKCVSMPSIMLDDELIQQCVKEIQTGLQHSKDVLSIKERVVIFNNIPYFFVPVLSKSSYYGTLVVVGMDCPNDLERIALAQTQQALCVAAFGNVRMDEYHERLRTEYLRDLLQGNFGNEDLIITQGRELDYDVQNVCCVIVATPFSCKEDEIHERVLNNIYLHARRLMIKSLISFIDNKIVILCNKDDKSDFFQSTRKISSAVESCCGCKPSIGIGSNCASVNEISLSYKHALDVMHLSRRIFNTPRTEQYESMQVFHLLLNNIDKPEASKVVNSLLDPLRHYDRVYNGNLEDLPKIPDQSVFWTYQECKKNNKGMKFLNLTGECQGFEKAK